MTTHEVSAVS